jgi:hypothetical protein
MGITEKQMQRLKEYAEDGTGVYRQAVGSTVRDYPPPVNTNVAWDSIKYLARRALVSSGALRYDEVDEKVLDKIVSEQRAILFCPPAPIAKTESQ